MDQPQPNQRRNEARRHLQPFNPDGRSSAIVRAASERESNERDPSSKATKGRPMKKLTLRFGKYAAILIAIDFIVAISILIGSAFFLTGCGDTHVTLTYRDAIEEIEKFDEDGGPYIDEDGMVVVSPYYSFPQEVFMDYLEEHDTRSTFVWESASTILMAQDVRAAGELALSRILSTEWITRSIST